MMVGIWHWVLSNMDRVLAFIAIVIAVVAMVDVRRLFRELERRDETTEDRVRKALLEELGIHVRSCAAFFRACQYLDFKPLELNRQSAVLMLMAFHFRQGLKPNLSKDEQSQVQKKMNSEMEKTAKTYAKTLIASGSATLKPGLEFDDSL